MSLRPSSSQTHTPAVAAPFHVEHPVPAPDLHPSAASPPAPLAILDGDALVQFVYDVGFAIDLDLAGPLVAQATQRETIRHRKRAPEHFEFRPAPLRFDEPGQPLAIGPGWAAAGPVRCTLYDFGAVCVTYTIPLAGTLEHLLPLAGALYENAALLEDSRARAEALVARIAAAVRRPSRADLVEDYVAYHVRAWSGPAEPAALLAGPAAAAVARLLRAEPAALGPQEIEDALACRIAFAPADLAVIDWNAALVLGDDTDDVLAVLEYANVELLEMRLMDDRLDDMLDAAYDAMVRSAGRGLGRLWPAADRAALRSIAAMQMDSALAFEGVNNALKLLGDQYLARVYKLAAQRLHLPEWDASILRKLAALDGIYQKLSDQHANSRMELLEWIIIILFVVSIVLPFFAYPAG